MSVSLAWLGVSTFRLTIGETVVYCDAYMDRVPSAPPVGVSSSQVERADYVIVGHSHFDHAWGAETIAQNTEATVVGSYETCRIMNDQGVPRRRLVAVSGGEPVKLGDDALLRVFPGLHSCIWSRGSFDASEECLGDVHVPQQERLERLRARGTRRIEGDAASEIARHRQATNQGAWGDGGALAYLFETPEGSVFWNDTSGYWTGVLRDVNPDVAILASAGRGNVDGEPVQGSLAQFVAGEAELLRPSSVVLCHHDDWMPPVTRPIDTDPIVHEIAKRGPHAKVLEMTYSEDRPLFA